MSVLFYLTELRKAMEPLGAQVSMHQVLTDPMFRLTYDREPLRGNACHYVFCIKTAGGKDYIADFTIEQFEFFGWWFVEKDLYLEQCTVE